MKNINATEFCIRITSINQTKIFKQQNQSKMKNKLTIRPAHFMFGQVFSVYLLVMLLPLMGMAQNKNVVSTHRVFPKVDKVLEFEKALAAHAKKYHTGDVAWTVFAIQTGPDFGGYQLTEGPKTWESEDMRGDLGEEHTLDWNKNVAIYLTDRQSAGYSVYVDSLSTVALNDFSEKVNITHVYPKVGHSDDVVKIIKKLKKTWEL